MIRNTLRSRIVGVAALAAAALIMSGCSAFEDLMGDDKPDRDEETGQVTEQQEDISVFDIEEGDCIGEFAQDSVDTVDLYPCDEEHFQQVFLITEIEQDELPGDEELEELVIDECLPAFEEHVGVAYEESELDVNYLAPSQDTWADGDRDIVCTVFDPAGTVTGSLEGADR
ncbi:septum formation family protein [Phytoactinopolyspora halophila]|uniref:septum formation family protein n=1 Tax=Phytoactinopolyspora halophila TaxID=1981511 RepID=UPI000F4F82BE|nr:septum formation family protein [Phytoactinopolyspora halophila]